MIKVALIGIGAMGFVHYEAYQSISNCKLVAVADYDTDHVKEMVNDNEIKIYKTLDEVLENEDTDVIDICTPSCSHVDLSIKALKYGKHVICEKPIALSFNEAKKVTDAAKKYGKCFMTAHVVRFMNAYKYLRSVIERKELGEIIRLDLKRLSEIPRWSNGNWMLNIDKSGGTPLDLGIHDIDYVQSIFGYKPDTYHSVYKALKNDNDFILTEMQFGNTVVTTEAAWYNAKIQFQASYYAVFQDGYIEFKDGDVYKNGELVELINENTEKQKMDLNITESDGYKGEIEYFLSCVENNTEPDFITPESTLHTMKLYELLLAKSN